MTNAPYLTDDHPDLDDENDRWYDDGEIYAMLTISNGRLIIHDFGVKDKTLVGARSGRGRQALKNLRPYFTEIIANGVIHPFSPGTMDDPTPVLFWQAMLQDGLIDSMILTGCDVEIRREDLGTIVHTSFGDLAFPHNFSTGPRP